MARILSTRILRGINITIMPGKPLGLDQCALKVVNFLRKEVSNSIQLSFLIISSSNILTVSSPVKLGMSRPESEPVSKGKLVSFITSGGTRLRRRR